MTVQPLRAAVSPHATAPGSPEPLLLVDQIQSLLESDVRTVQIKGHGKTTALNHLASEFDPFEIVLLDDIVKNDLFPVSQFEDAKLIVFTSRLDLTVDRTLHLTPWGQDDVIAFVVEEFPQQCKSVLSRVTTAGDGWMANGTPAIWSPVLRTMAESETVQNVRQALGIYLNQILLDDELSKFVRQTCAANFMCPNNARYELSRHRPDSGADLIRLVGQKNICQLLAADEFAKRIRENCSLDFLTHRWPDSLTNFVVERVRNDDESLQVLNELACRRDDAHSATAASILVKAKHGWRPKPGRALRMNFAKLQGVDWRSLKIHRGEFVKTNLSNANLQGAKLYRLTIVKSTLTNANLQRACLVRVRAPASNFSNANLQDSRLRKMNGYGSDFSNANLQGVVAPSCTFCDCNFSNANLQDGKFFLNKFDGANFNDANLSGADFSQSNLNRATFNNTNLANANFRSALLKNVDLRAANLSNARFSQARLAYSTFEDQSLSGTDFKEADLSYATFTNTKIRNAKLSMVNLKGAKLAGIDWEDCDLRGANFKGCHFHLGSTRCGMVDSPYPSHGTRTGFYTDDYDEQYFKRPEEIRKANLCGCDLSGAEVFKADFYLVDLRRAKYDEEQEAHFRRCKAILS